MATKIEDVVMYILSKINGSQLGLVKLNKILWFSDLKKYKEYATTITDGQYLKKEYGPVYKNLKLILRNLAQKRKISIDKKNPDSMWLYYPLTDIENNILCNEDKVIIDMEIERLRAMTANDISDMTHTPYWASLQNGDSMSVAMEAIEQLGNCDIESIDWAKHAEV